MKRLACLLLALVLMFSLAACGGASAEDYIKSKLDQFIAGTGLEDLQDELGGDAIKLLQDSLEYEILSSTESGSSATVVVRVSNLDMASAIANWAGEIMLLALEQAMLPVDQQLSEDALEQQLSDLLCQCMTAEEITTVTQELTLSLIKGDEGWRLDTASLSALSDAMIGGGLTAIMELSGS